MKISLLINMKMPTIMKISLLINMKMPTIVGIFIFISREKKEFAVVSNLIFISKTNFILADFVQPDQTQQYAASLRVYTVSIKDFF